MPGSGLLTGQDFPQAIAGPLLLNHCPRRHPGIFRLFHTVVILKFGYNCPMQRLTKAGSLI